MSDSIASSRLKGFLRCVAVQPDGPMGWLVVACPRLGTNKRVLITPVISRRIKEYTIVRVYATPVRRGLKELYVLP
jgi:hypothetical protein